MVLFRPASRRRSAPPAAGDPWQLLRYHGDDLASAAASVRDRFADAALVGVILAPGARHGDALRAMLRRCSGDADATAVCVGLLPRADVEALLHDGFSGGANAASLQSYGCDALPVVIATGVGLRIGSVPLPRSGGAD